MSLSRKAPWPILEENTLARCDAPLPRPLHAFMGKSEIGGINIRIDQTKKSSPTREKQVLDAESRYD